jgi:hypothetical protein
LHVEVRRAKFRLDLPVTAVRHALCFALALLVSATLGETYISRLSDRRGFSLITVDDEVAHPVARPRHLVFILIDGLRLDFAEKTAFRRRIAASARCFVTSVGLPSVSAPVYAVDSTGLEQDRTGVRNNDDHSAVAAESIWDVAIEGGLSVEGRSSLAWWAEMFPNGFTHYTTLDAPDADPLELGPAEVRGDVILLHPLYVDSAGHEHGAASPEYAKAVERADRGVNQVLDRLDLSKDTVIITADHGHALRGGHGGAQPDIMNVLTCYAGFGVHPSEGTGPMDNRTIAPSIAVLVGLRFPRNMRAFEDDLDTIFAITSTAAYPSAYLADRRQAIARFRKANADEIGSWSAFYRHARDRQSMRGGFVLAVFASLLLGSRRRETHRSPLTFVVPWILAIVGGSILFHLGLLDVFDSTCINIRDDYIRTEFVTCGLAIGLGVAVHALRRKSALALARDLWTLVFAAVALEVAHVAAFGWPIEPPLPGPVLFFLPFFQSIFTSAAAIAGLLTVLVHAIHSRRAETVQAGAGR